MSCIDRIAKKYSCSKETAERYLDLREEGYSTYQAKLMAGLVDPPEPDERESNWDEFPKVQKELS